jgi:hypothetical protein
MQGSRPERCSSPEMGERGRKSGLAGFISCRWMPNGVRGSAEPSHGADPLPDRDCAAGRGPICQYGRDKDRRRISKDRAWAPSSGRLGHIESTRMRAAITSPKDRARPCRWQAGSQVIGERQGGALSWIEQSKLAVGSVARRLSHGLCKLSKICVSSCESARRVNDISFQLTASALKYAALHPSPCRQLEDLAGQKQATVGLFAASAMY